LQELKNIGVSLMNVDEFIEWIKGSCSEIQINE